MSEFKCPKCEALNRPARGEQGCMACGFGRQHRHSIERPAEQQAKPKVEAPPGYKGDYLTEVR